MPDTLPQHGLTPAELAKFWRVSADFVRDEIRAGRLKAINTARRRCGRPRFIILPHHAEEWERSHQAMSPEKPVTRRKKLAGVTDFYPD